MSATSLRHRSLTAAAAAAVAIAVGIAAVAIGSHSDTRQAFGWVRPASAPAGWELARTPGGASFAYPPGWHAIHGDLNASSVALIGSGGRIVGYVNATPKEGAETLADWRGFRPEHNRDEGDRNVRVLDASGGLRFRSGEGSCVVDTYTTSTDAYREIACLVDGGRGSAVIVAAAPADLWAREAPTLERAVASFNG